MCFIMALQVTSVAAIVMGAWVLSERGHLVRDSASFFLDPSAMLCLLGALTFLVAFCGCLGALRENVRLLKVVGSYSSFVYSSFSSFPLPPNPSLKW